MKRILILLLGLFSVAYGQFSPTSAKSAFKWGVSIGTRDSTAYAANDSLVVVINRQGRLMYRSTDGYWKLLANAASSDYVPYTGAVDNVALGNFRITARSVKTDSIYANGSGGMYLLTNSGNPVAHWGAGGSVEVDFKGFAGYDANRSASYTARSFTDKNYVDSSAGLRVRYSDTAAMLADYVDLSSTQTVNGIKNFSNDITVNGYTIGRGANSNSGNLAIGSLTLTATTAGSLPNIAIGNSALRNITTGANNVAIGTNIMTGSTVGSGNTNVGQNSFADVTSGGNNTSLGNIAGRFTSGSASVTSIDNSTYIGANTRPSATTGVTNETALGYLAIGNGSNTVTIGNSSVTDNYFTGNIRGGAFIKSGGTSSQFLKADGSVDGTSYATAASISGTTNYIPKFTASGTIGNSDLRTDASNNLGLGVTPSAWGTSNSVKAFELATGGLWNFNTVSNIYLSSNLYLNSSLQRVYKSNGAASEYAQIAGEHQWHTASSGTAGNVITFSNPMTLSSSQLGLTVPINGTSLSMSGGISGQSLALQQGAGASAFAQITGAGDASHGLIMRGIPASGTTSDFSVTPTDVMSFYEFGGDFRWYKKNGSLTTQMRLTGDAELLIAGATTDGTNKLIVNGGVKANNSFQAFGYTNLPSTGSGIGMGFTGGVGYIQSWSNNAQAPISIDGSSFQVRLNNYATTALSLAATTGAATFSSSVTATGFFESSDLRLKNIVKRDGDVVYFNWKDGQDKKLHIGYIAQEVQKTNPDQVKADEKGMLSVNYTEVLVQKVRELEKQIAELQKRIK